MLFPALVLAAITARTELLNETVKVPRSQVQALTLEVRDRPATIEVDYRVTSGRSGVRVVLMTDEDAKRFVEGKRYSVLRDTEYRREGHFRYFVGNPGEYRIILDNRLEGRDPAEMKVKVNLAYHDYAGFAPKQLPEGKRRAVVAGSLGAFVAVGLVIGAKLWPTLRLRQ